LLTPRWQGLWERERRLVKPSALNADILSALGNTALAGREDADWMSALRLPLIFPTIARMFRLFASGG